MQLRVALLFAMVTSFASLIEVSVVLGRMSYNPLDRGFTIQSVPVY
jgi:hypothetical protein